MADNRSLIPCKRIERAIVLIRGHNFLLGTDLAHLYRAVEVNIQIMRAFVRLRNFLATHRELADKLKALEHKLGAHDQQIEAIFEAIHQLMAPLKTKRRPIGFFVSEKASATVDVNEGQRCGRSNARDRRNPTLQVFCTGSGRRYPPV